MSEDIVELDLPLEIIQHIQSFLSPKESAQTSILSKPWFSAWATPPALSLYQEFFRDGYAVSDEFWNFCRKSLQRYKDLNRKLDKLFLRINVSLPSTAIPFLDEFITDALNLGTNVLHLHSTYDYVLPAQLFEAKSLTELSVLFAVINPRMIMGRPLWSGLKSLELHLVHNAHRIVGDILLGCPFIENLVLWFRRDVTFSTTIVDIDVSKMRKLVRLCVIGHDSVRVQFKDFDGTLCEFPYLLKLELSQVELDTEFFRDFSSRFPCIQDFDFGCLTGCENIQISSHSLRCLGLEGDVLGEVRLDVPNLLKFSFIGINSRTPCLSFGNAVVSNNLKCHVKVDFVHDVLEDSWFLGLKKFLTELSLSRISLCIFFCAECNVVSAEMIPSFPIPVVEDLEFFVVGPRSWNMSTGLLSRLFWTCRPSFITLPSYVEEPTRQLLYEQLILKDNKDLFCMYNLKKANLELFENNLKEWQTIPSEKLVNAPKIPHEGKRIRFRLSWGPEGLSGWSYKVRCLRLCLVQFYKKLEQLLC